MSVIRKKNVPMAALAFFYLAFFGVEYLFDEKVALLAGAGSVAMAESVVVGISVAGFLLYPPALRFSERRIKPLLLVAGGLAAACSVEIGVAEQPVAVYVAGAVGLLCLGFVGTAAHDAVAREREDAYLGVYACRPRLVPLGPVALSWASGQQRGLARRRGARTCPRHARE